ncbi:hypothetical protein NLG97_g3442 [Lecanicillium saksenae]|uniref:Uncharacterized protein n=1 Tax=Lecanicillium saksenae TaxID=468837 RepID=A0ACC1QZH5_9HYPO|nr:hypothetical protein NLG97_g3442 [Lecanicillium saksenae]
MPKSAKARTGERKRSFVDDGGDDQHESEIQSRNLQTTLHLENQERAYVAASRRTDRNLEARYQSALMASEVHKKCTGRSLRIIYKIVEDEEMYEEEDQGLPESWQLSHNSYRGRTLSQTDAYIAALIARISGMQNYFEHNNALFAYPLLNNAARAGPPPAMPSHNHQLRQHSSQLSTATLPTTLQASQNLNLKPNQNLPRASDPAPICFRNRRLLRANSNAHTSLQVTLPLVIYPQKAQITCLNTVRMPTFPAQSLSISG